MLVEVTLSDRDDEQQRLEQRDAPQHDADDQHRGDEVLEEDARDTCGFITALPTSPASTAAIASEDGQPGRAVGPRQARRA